MKIPQTWHKHYMCMICTNVDTINHQVDGVVRDREHSEPRRGQNAWMRNIHHAWTSEIDGTKLSHREKFTITTLVHQSSEQSPRKYDIGDDTTRWITVNPKVLDQVRPRHRYDASLARTTYLSKWLFYNPRYLNLSPRFDFQDPVAASSSGLVPTLDMDYSEATGKYLRGRVPYFE